MSDFYKGLLEKAHAFDVVADVNSSHPEYKERIQKAAVAVVQNYRKQQVKYPVTTLKKQLQEEYTARGKSYKIINQTISFLEEVEELSKKYAKGQKEYRKIALSRLRKLGLA